jgi:hypothetical protein
MGFINTEGAGGHGLSNKTLYSKMLRPWSS